MIRTRTRLAFVGIVLLVAASGLPPSSTTATAARHTFVVEQGDRCFEVTPLQGGEDVVSFYDYRNIENDDGSDQYTYSSYMPSHLTAEGVSRLFLYEGPNGVSLVIVHNQRGGDRGDGSAATFRFSGLPSGGGWVVADDDYRNQDDQSSRNRIDWSWYGDRTDGAVFRGLDRDGTAVTIDPAFDEEAALYDSPVARSGRTRAWQFLTGSVGSPSAVGLDMSQPITIRTGHCGVDENPPSADLSSTSGVAGFGVPFDASGSTDDRGVAEYRWDFDGDGTVDRRTDDPTVGHVFREPGTYNATVTAVDRAGNADSATVRVEVSADDPPSAAFRTGDSPTAGHSVGFDARNATDDVGVAEFRWDFDGDGTVDRRTEDPTVGHVYDEPGTYNATLTVVDGGGNNATATRRLSVDADDPPKAAIRLVSPETPVEREQVIFSARNATDDTGIVEYRWSLGGNVTATGERVAYTYPDNGTYNVTLEVVDESGNNATATLDLEVLPPDETPPDAVAAADRKWVEADANVTLDATESSDDRTVASYRWEFGDGTAATGTRTTHVYDEPGTYNATVFVTDGGGNVANATVTVEVLPARPPNVTASVPETVVVNETFRVEGSATDGGRLAGLRWSFDDGTEATGERATHSFGTVGNHTVTLTAVDRGGHANATSETVRVLPPDETPPNARLSASANVTRAGETVTFDASNATDGRDIANYLWNFDGDNRTDRTTSNATVSKAYSSAGTYNATVTVVDGGGNTANATVTVEVKPEKQAHRGGGGGGGGGGGVNIGPPPVHTEIQQTGPNAATVDVQNGRDDEPIRAELPESAAANETGVAFRGVTVALARDDPHFAVMVARPADESPPADVTLGSLAVRAKYLPASGVETATYEVGVQRSRLDDAGIEPDDLAVYQRKDGEWTRVDTTVAERGASVVLRAETDALAPIAVGADRPATLAEARLSETTVTADRPVSVTATVRNPGDDPERFAANLTVDGEVVATETVEVAGGATTNVTFERGLAPGTHEVGINGRRVGSVTVEARTAELAVADVSLNATTVTPGEQVEVTAAVENTGGKAGERTVALTLFGEEVATRTVTVPASETRNVTFVRTVDAAGSYAVKVGNQTATLKVRNATDGPTQTTGSGHGGQTPDVPGFGVGAALAALFAAALLARLRRR